MDRKDKSKSKPSDKSISSSDELDDESLNKVSGGKGTRYTGPNDPRLVTIGMNKGNKGKP